MKIGIISDSHSKVDLCKCAIKKLIKEKCEFLVHAGDIVKKENLELLEKSSLPYIAVLGNNDRHLAKYVGKYHLVREPFEFKLDKITIKLMHHPFYMKANSDIIIYGHTHYAEAYMKKGSLYLNSGEICARKKDLCECMSLEVKKDEYIVKRFFTDHKKIDWQSKKKEFKR